MSRYFPDRNMIPRVKRYVEENQSVNGYVDIDIMVDGLQHQYLDYRRQKKLTFKRNVQDAYEEVRRMLHLEKVVDSDSDIDCDMNGSAMVLASPKKEIGNELMRKLYNNKPPVLDSKLDDIMVIDVIGDRPDIQSPRTPSFTDIKKISKSDQKKPMKRKKVVSEDGEIEKKKKTGAHNFESVISTTKIADIVLDNKNIQEVKELVLQNMRPELCRTVGINPPCGFMLHGPSGCGKTFLVHAIAGELGIPLFKVPATELVSGVSGESEETIRSLFDQARSNSPCVVFIDEIDSVAPKRESAHREMERRIVSQLLTCMDDLKADNSNVQVLVIGATNRIDAIDASLRSRFHKEIALNIPDKAAREKILKVVCGKLRLSPDFSQCHWDHLAVNTPGYVGGDIKALALEAGTIAVNRAFSDVEAEHLTSLTEKMADVLDAAKSESSQSAVNGNSWSWLYTQVIGETQLESLFVTFDDFCLALKRVQPTALREGFATVPNVTWEQVGALSDVRDELKMSILMPIRYADLFEKEMGGMIANGILLYGPPGCGKTLLAKAIANEAGINFISVKGPELLNMVTIFFHR